MAKLVIKTELQAEAAIAGLQTKGLFAIRYVSDKARSMKAAVKKEGHTLSTITSMVINITSRDYSDIVLKGERESKGTYAKAVSNNKLLWEGITANTAGQKYLRFYRLQNAVNCGTKNTAFFVDGKKVTKEVFNARKQEWYTPASLEPAPPTPVHNIKLCNLLKLKQGGTVIDFKY